MEGDGSGVCVVCGKVVSDTLVNVHASLVAQNGTIHTKMGQVVGVEQMEEACRDTELVCSVCLKVLLNIVNLECKVTLLKDEFRCTFERGTQSRKRVVTHRLDNNNTQTSMLSDEKIVKVEEFLTNIPMETDNNSGTTFITCDTTHHNVNNLLIKRESIASDKQHLDTHLTDTAGGGGGELNDLIPPPPPPPSQMEGGVPTPTSQGEEKALSDAPNTPSDAESDPLALHSYDTHSPGDALNTVVVTPMDGDDGGSDADSHVVESHCVSSPIDRKTSLHPQTAVKQVTEQYGSHTTPPPQTTEEGMMTPTNTQEYKIETQEEDTSKESETTTAAAQVVGVEEFVMSCELCGDRFIDAIQLGNHRKESHSDVYSHVCALCPNTAYREKSKLTQHLHRNHNITAHKCPGCSHQAVSQNALDQHIIRDHPESRFFECHICHKAFRTHRYLHFVHIKRCHLGLPIKYSCEHCSKGFVDKSSFENHKLIHSQAKNFRCEFCGSSFLTRYALKVHVNTHTREKKYQCEDCGSAFLRMCNLCAHRRRFHSSNDVRLVCEVCGKSMTTRKDLRRHQVAQHSNEKPFKCPHCTRCYAAKESLRSHLRTHSGDKPYVCGECGKGFHKSNVLRRHQRCVHEGEDVVQQEQQEVQDTEAPTAALDCVQIDSSEMVSEEHMVVITLKECNTNPSAVYTVQTATTPQLEEILVSSEAMSSNEADVSTNASLLAEEAVDDGIPLLHSALDAGTGGGGGGRLSISTPAVLLPSLPSITIPDITTFTTSLDTSLSTFHASPHHTIVTPPTTHHHTIIQTKTHHHQEPLDTLVPASCTDLLHLPALHSATTATSVSLVTPWSSSPL